MPDILTELQEVIDAYGVDDQFDHVPKDEIEDPAVMAGYDAIGHGCFRKRPAQHLE